MKKRIATIIFTVISFVIISSYSVYAENVVLINDNFENLSTSNWIAVIQKFRLGNPEMFQHLDLLWQAG